MTKSELITFKAYWATAAQSKTLTAAHHVLYNLLRGYEPHHGFTPITRHTKLANGAIINGGVVEATRRLKFIVSLASKEGGNETEQVKQFIAPFKGSLTAEHLAAIPVPTISAIESGFGIGSKIASKIISDNLTHLTFDDIAALSVELAA